jgi:hypothetical protein
LSGARNALPVRFFSDTFVSVEKKLMIFKKSGENNE